MATGGGIWVAIRGVPEFTSALGISRSGQSAARDLGLAGEAADVQLKLLASLPPDAAADVGRIAERFHVDPLPLYHRPEALPLLPALAAAVWEGKQVRVR